MTKIKRKVSGSLAANDNRLEHPGTYHLGVITVDVSPVKNGKMFNGWVITAGVLDGTARQNDKCIERNKTIEIRMNDPKPNHNDGGEFCQKIQDRFLLAVGLINESDAGEEREIDLDEAVGRQFIAKFKAGTFTSRDGSERETIELDGAYMYHVDDSAVAAIPKDEQMLANIPAALRRNVESKASEKRQEKSPSTVKREPVKDTQYKETVQKSTEEVSFDDL